jgi:hypothetical protein
MNSGYSISGQYERKHSVEKWIPRWRERSSMPLVSMSVVIAMALTIGTMPAVEASALASPSVVSSFPHVELTTSQLQAITIAPLGTYRFPLEREEIGNISFEEDPAVVAMEASLIAAAASEELTAHEFQRATALKVTQSVSQREWEQARSDHETAQAALSSALVAVRALGVSTSDIQGMTTTRHMPASVGASAPWITVFVLQDDIALMHLGQPLSVRVDAFPGKVFAGEVRNISAVVDPTTHRMTMHGTVTDPTRELRPGMPATATIRLQDSSPSPAIPANGVVRKGDGTWTAWITTDRKHFEQRTVTLGLRANAQVQLLTGLQPHDLVVTDGALFLDNMLESPPSD